MVSLCVIICVSIVLAPLAFCKYQDCTEESDLATLDKIVVSDCQPDDKICVLHKGKVMDVQITFTPREKINSVKTNLHGILGGVPVPFPVEQKDCASAGLECPIPVNQQSTYKFKMPVENWYPNLPVTVWWKLEDDQNRTIWCFKIPAKIKN